MKKANHWCRGRGLKPLSHLSIFFGYSKVRRFFLLSSQTCRRSCRYIKCNGFLPPVIKGKDGHFLNAIHTLEYFDRIKIPGYDAHLSSLSADTHARRCCTTCNKYFPTVAFLTKHKKFAHPSPTRRRLNRLETNSAIIDDFSTLSSPFFEEVSVVIDYMSDGEIC